MDVLPKVSVQGSSSEIGFQHGRQAKEQIAACLAAYRDIFKQSAGLDDDQVQVLAKQFQRDLSDQFPDLFQEMEGIAAGAGVDVLQIIGLNCRSEIALTSQMDGCSALSMHVDNKQYCAQNWDWKPSIASNLILLDIAAHGNRPAIKQVVEAGMIGKIGMNEYGVSTLLNAIRTPALNTKRIPLHFLLRRMLECHDIDECRQRLAEFQASASAGHILLGDPHTAIGVEATPAGFAILKPDADGRIFHTNHLLDQHMSKTNREILLWKDSPPRLSKLHELAAHSDQAKTAEEMFQILSDRSLGPGGICRHDSTGNKNGSDTLFTVVHANSQHEMSIKLGFPDGDKPITKISFK